MLPLLYETTSSDVSIGSLKYLGRIVDCASCFATETLNGDYLLKAEIKESDELYNVITVQQFIQIKSNPFDEPQFFEIYEIERNTNGNLSIKAKHIKHCSYNNLMTSGASNDTGMTPQEIWKIASKDAIFTNNFNFYSDVTDKISFFNIGFKKVGTFGNFFEEIASKFNGEFHWDNFNVQFLKSRGSKKNYCLRWGVNISSLVQTLSTEGIKSHVIAAATVHDEYTDEDIQIICEPYEIAGQQSKTKKLLLIDATKLVKDITVNSHTGENYEYVKNSCRIAAISHFKKSEPAKIKVNIVVDYRSDLDNMKAFGLADEIDVIIDSKNRKANGKITEAEYDCLLERWEKLKIGTLKARLSDYF